MAAFTKTLLLFTVLNFQCCFIQSQSSKKRWQKLDSTNLRTLNREVRKAFLTIVPREMTEAKALFDAMRPQLLECQQKVMTSVGTCMECVDKKCRERMKECGGTANIVIPGGSGVSVSGHTDSMGKYYVTVCAVLQDNSRACRTIMNPDGVMSSSISNIGNNILVHLRGAVTDMGGYSVGMFINGMQTFIGGYHPLNGNYSTLNETEVRELMKKREEEYRRIRQRVNSQMRRMNEQIRRNMARHNQNLRMQMNQLNRNLNQMNQNIRRNVDQQNMNLNRQMQNMNRNMNQWSQNFNRGMQQFSRNLNQQMQQMSYNLNNMFAGTWMGRRKRSAESHRNIRAAGDCGLIYLDGSTQSCMEYKSMCSACANQLDSTKNATMEKICGRSLINNMTNIERTLEQMERIYDQVIESRDFVTKVRFDTKSAGTAPLTFKKVKVTAEINGLPETFRLNEGLSLLNLPETGANVATEIWRIWTSKI